MFETIVLKMAKFVSSKYSWSNIFLLLSLLMFAFVTNSNANIMAEAPVVWYITGEAILYALFLVVVFFPLSILFKKIKIDGVAIILALRCFVCFIPLLYVTGDLRSFSSHYLVTYYSVFVYLIALNDSKANILNNTKIVVIWGLILIVQVFITFVRIEFSYFDYGYKSSMSIPLASSNGIGAYIVPIMFLFFYSVKVDNKIKYLILALFVVATILTRSRGGIVCVIITYFIYKVSIKHKISIIYIFFILSLIALIIIFALKIPEIEQFFLGFTSADEALDANNLSSGRVDLIEFELERWLNHPVFGNGMIFNDTTTLSGAHNFIVDLLAQGGLVGLLTYLIPLTIVFKKAYRYRKNNEVLGWMMCVIALLIYGLFEANMFTYPNELLLWTACGIIMSFKKENAQTKK